MMLLLRVGLPDRPGSLGRAATAIATTGADIAGIRIAGRLDDGVVVDDFICDLPRSVLPDGLVSALHAVEDTRVLWVSRCPDEWDAVTEVELIGQMAADPLGAEQYFLDHAPALFHCQWAAVVDLDDRSVLFVTEHTPELTPERLAGLEPLDELHSVEVGSDWAPGWGDAVVAVVPVLPDRVVLMGRSGGPAFLTAELDRLSRVAQVLSGTFGTARLES